MRAFRTGHVSTRLSDTGAFRLMIVLAVIVAMSVPVGAGAGMARLNEAELQAAELDLTGQVVDMRTGLPIANATVAAWWYDDVQVQTEELGETHTNANGEYVLQDALQFGPGWYEVYAEADGYASSAPIWVQWDGIEPFVLDFELDWLSTAAFNPAAPNGNNGWYNKLATPPLAITIESNDDDRVDDLQWKLNEGGWITGTTVTGIVDGEHTLYHRAIEKDTSVEPTREVSFKVDTVPPVTTTDVQPTYVGSATITLTPTDATSGVASTFYILDGGETLAYTEPIVVDTPGNHLLVYGSTDNAGNNESVKEVAFEVTEDGTPSYTLTYTAGTGGVISGESPQTVEPGGSGTEVTAVPNAGYHFVKWSDDVMTASRTDTDVTADLAVTAVFALDTYTITATAGAGGTISPPVTSSSSTGRTSPSLVTPDAGYEVDAVMVDDEPAALDGDTYTFVNVTADHTIHVTFALKTSYTLTYTAGTGGTVSGQSPQTVEPGGSGTEVTAVPNAGYDFVGWSDGVMTPNRTDTDVTADISDRRTSSSDTYTITATAGAGGYDRSGSGDVIVEHG
jgi:5-hydroxyisourate hydrolase-like protein (transthyretin family)